MREIAVVKGGEREDAQGVEESRDADCRPTPPDPDHAQAHQVDNRVGSHPRPIEALIRMIDRNSRGLLGEKPTTEAAKDGPRLRWTLLFHWMNYFPGKCAVRDGSIRCISHRHIMDIPLL